MEKEAVLAAASSHAQASGGRVPTMAEVVRAETLWRRGLVDYGANWALYVAEMVQQHASRSQECKPA